VFTVAVGDRAELRWIANEDDTYYEAEDGAQISARLDGRRSTVGLAYSPSIVVSPLERESDGRPRTVYILHRVGLDASIGWQLSRRTSLTLSQTAGYDRANTRAQALSARNAPGQAPAVGLPGGNNQGGTNQGDNTQQQADTSTNVYASNVTTEVVSERTELALGHTLSHRSNAGASVGYSGSVGVGASRGQFPLVQGPDAAATYGYQISRNDDTGTRLDARYAFSSTGDRAFTASLTQGYNHKFSRYASMGIGAGVTYVWFDPANGPPQDQFFFGSGAGGQLGFTFTHRSKLNGGILTLFAGASYAPVLDQSRLTQGTQQTGNALTPDVRVGVFSGADWVKGRLTLYANAATIVSAEPNDPGALNSIGAALGSIYDLGAGFHFEAGARGGWQTFNGEELLAPSVALFVSLSWGAVLLRE